MIEKLNEKKRVTEKFEIDQNSDQYIFLARLGLKITMYGLS